MAINFRLIKKNLTHKGNEHIFSNYAYSVHYVDSHQGKHPTWSRKRILKDIQQRIREDYQYGFEEPQPEADFITKVKPYII